MSREQAAPAETGRTAEQAGTVRPHRSRAEMAADFLALVATQAEPGDRLGSRADLRSRCGVSVGTFNEGLRIAQSKELVFLRPGPGGGVFATHEPATITLGNSVLALDSDGAVVEEAVRIRDVLEALVIDDALWHASPADIAEMRSILADMSAAADAADHLGFVRANWRLHSTIASVGPDSVLQSLYTSLLRLIESHTLKVLPSSAQPLPEFVAERYRVHAGLVDALADRDRDRALALMVQHNLRPSTAHSTGGDGEDSRTQPDGARKPTSSADQLGE